MNSERIILSHFQAVELQKAFKAQQRQVKISLDLGKSFARVELNAKGVRFKAGESLTWKKIRKIGKSPSSCFLVENHSIWKIQFFSERTDLNYSLMATEGAPTMLISGIPMHRIKATDPQKDTVQKIKAVQPVVGKVLDTSMGLGYTAIMAANTAERVVTIELSPATLKVAGYNPWSEGLFNNPKISKVIGDSSLVIRNFQDNSFQRIIHDPPAYRLAGHLFSSCYYRQLYRILRGKGKIVSLCW